MAGVVAAFLGRKPALWEACLLNFVALAIQIATTNKGVLYFGRLLLGFSNGFLVTFSNVYTAEIAPAHLRGLMVALFAYWVNIGAIWGTIVDNYTAPLLSKGSYRIPIACLYIVPTMLGIGLFFVPESPRWLLHRNREQDARKSLETLKADSVAPEYLELEWAEMIRGMEEEKRIAKPVGIKGYVQRYAVQNSLVDMNMAHKELRGGSPSNSTLLWRDWNTSRLWIVVYHLLHNILLHNCRHRQTLLILDHEYMHRFHRCQLWNVCNSSPCWSQIHSHLRIHRLWPLLPRYGSGGQRAFNLE